MSWTLTTSLAEFRAAAGGFLAAEPARNTVLLTIVDRLAKDGPHAFGAGQPRFGCWRTEPHDPVAGAFVQTPPFGPVLGVMPGAAAAGLAEVLHGTGAVPAVQGNKMVVTVFGRAWERLTGTEARVQVYERLYRLGELAQPDPAPSGRWRPAGGADRELLVAWYEAFAAESEASRVGADHGAMVDRRIADGSLHLWEDDGHPVSLAGVSPVIAGMSRVAPVFTPVELRRRGYASGVVAAGSAYALAQGAQEVVLYTDLENPVSNSIYQKLGYRPVEEALMLDLTGGSQGRRP